MIFSELYSAYYTAVAEILKRAIDHPLQKKELQKIVEEQAFRESVLHIESALSEERWQLLKADGTTPICHEPSMPLTILQKRWLKAISLDPRIRLFQDEPMDFPGVDPLFTPKDFNVFDRYEDGDDYEDESYRANFRQILDALRNQYPLRIDARNQKEEIMHIVLFPEYLEYSEKDDKFRLVGAGCRFVGTVNVGRIKTCERDTRPFAMSDFKKRILRPRSVVFELVDERNALERVLMHFAHFEKQAERLDEKHYRIILHYDKEDETELVIRMLSFGPMVKVTAPQHFVELIKQRLLRQKNCK